MNLQWIHRISFATLLLVCTLVASDEDCAEVLSCNEGASCLLGEADFSEHPTKTDGVIFDFLQVTDKSGFYCDCPDGLTGLRCNRPYEVCDSNWTHVCYHGGRCIAGLDDSVDDELLFCDCSDAEHNGIPYMGKFCEVEGAVQCGYSDVFCVNGGTCKEDFATMAHPCDCPEGHRGPHCEFDTGHVPECTLDCENDGACTLGIRDYEEAIYNEFWAAHDGSFQYCSCMNGWFGTACEIQGEVCGDNHCFNGAVCLETEHSDGEVDFECDCSTASDSDSSFAGEYCENEATSYCSKDLDQNGQLFCTNGGTCSENNLDGCYCPDGYFGSSCEFREDFQEQEDECTLVCENGGKCRSGKKNNELLEQFGDELKMFNETHTLWEHCICPDGYFGIQCEHELQICSGGEHICLHGSTCVGSEDDGLSCDCNSTMYAGAYCQYSSTSVCTDGYDAGVGSASTTAFCVNNGECKAIVAAGEDHPGCTCDNEFTGDHCELLVSSQSSSSTSSDEEEDGGASGGVVALAVAVGVLGALVCLLLLRRSKLNRPTSSFDPKTLDDAWEPPRSITTEEDTVDVTATPSPADHHENLQTVEII